MVRRRRRMAGHSRKPVQKVAISEFKAKCLSLLDGVNKTKTPLRITRRGKAIADVIPAAEDGAGRSWIGSMKDIMDITGDVVSPVIDVREIEAMKK
jgi:prevent-host-death family protein